MEAHRARQSGTIRREKILMTDKLKKEITQKSTAKTLNFSTAAVNAGNAECPKCKSKNTRTRGNCIKCLDCGAETLEV